MANSDKNILITPNTGSATLNPLIRFTGANNTPITLRTLDTGTVSFEGTSGQLFSIADGMSGTIFSVNDISGIPSIEVLDTGTIKLAQYGGNVGIGNAAPLVKFVATGTGTSAAMPTLGTASGVSYISASTGTYGLLTGVNYSTGDVWMQAQRTDGNATPYNILLNPSGANVGIGGNAAPARLHTVLASSYTAGGSWSTNTAVFATGTSATSGAFAISYDDSAGARLTSLVPGTAWKPLTINAVSTSINYAGTLTGIVLDGSGNVGIGTSSISNKFVIAGGVGEWRFNPSNITVGSNSAGYGTTFVGGLPADISTASGGAKLFLGGDGRGDSLISAAAFFTNATERMRINSAGLVTIPGALTVTGTITGTLSGNASSATIATSAKGMGQWDGTTYIQGVSPMAASGSRSTVFNPNAYAHGIFYEFKNTGFGLPAGNYGGLITIAPWDSTTASTGDSSYQLMLSPAAANSTATPNFRMRAGIDTTWGAWVNIVHTGGGQTISGSLVLAGTQAAATTPAVRNISMSTAAPSGGADGDVWIKYV